jgi:hypothetical protein
MAKLPKRPRDTAQLAKFMVEMAAGKRPRDVPKLDDEAAVERGKARDKALTKAEKVKIAKKGAAARWKKKRA